MSNEFSRLWIVSVFVLFVSACASNGVKQENSTLKLQHEQDQQVLKDYADKN